MIDLNGASDDEIEQALTGATAPEDLPIVEVIAKQVEEFDAQPPYTIRAYGKETVRRYIHGVTLWWFMLKDGIAKLPARIPTAVLAHWRDNYESPRGYDNKPWSPQPHFRCADCLMVLPTGGAASDPWPNCPVCGGRRIASADLTRPIGENWVLHSQVRQRSAANED